MRIIIIENLYNPIIYPTTKSLFNVYTKNNKYLIILIKSIDALHV